MMQAIEGIYQNGQIQLLEVPKKIRRSRVVVTFLDDGDQAVEDSVGLSNLGEIVGDLDGGSREIRAQFLNALDRSGEELHDSARRETAMR